jgi:sporulation protein YlmC with PRC-barrel domain
MEFSMRSKLLIGGLLASVMVLPALAQSTPPAPAKPAAPAATPAPAPAARSTTAATTPATQSGMWRTSKLIGLNVYNDQNEKLGDISEILLDKAGKVEGVVIGVGGFLGMGQHDIKVDMSKLKFVDEPVKTSSTTTTTSTTTGAARPATTTTTSSSANDHKWYPDHAVLSGATKDQLKGMPQFKYN